MIEKPPKYKVEDNTLSLLVKLQQNGLLKDIQDDYLYWDKVKYKSKDVKPEELWNAVKLHRLLKYSTVKFGKHRFTFMITDFMQRALHQFDMHIGGTLGSNIGIAETDKTKFIISSIMEEAISS